MKLSIDRNSFLRALFHGQSVVEKRTTLPILSHTLLQADGVALKMTSTDLEISIVETVSATVHEPGKTTVSTHLLYDIVRKLREGSKIDLELDKEKGQLHITSGASNFRLSCLPAEDFPVISTAEMPYKFKVPSRHLRKLLERTRFAMSTEETRYFLNGIYLHSVDGKELRAVATDGHRLAQVSIPLPEGAQEMPGVIVSRKTVNELFKLAADCQDDVEVAVSETQIAFSIMNAYLTSRLIDGTYPDYQEAIPKNNSKIVSLDIKSFTQAVDRVATIATDKFSGVRVRLENGKLTLSAANEETGSAQEEINVEYAGEGVNIGLNSRYLMDITQQIEAEQAQFSMADGNVPIMIRSPEDESSLYVLMPMRV